MGVYRCDVCNLEQDDSDDFEATCPQCGTPEQFYLVDQLVSDDSDDDSNEI